MKLLLPGLLIVALGLGGFLGANAEQKESLSTRATRAEGVLLCGAEPLRNATIRLFKDSSEDIKNVLGTVKTNDVGHFIIEGNTGHYLGTEANIDPHVRIYSKCGDAEGKKGHRRITLRYPRDFVTIGRVARRTYDFGTLNLQLIYPKETRVNKVEGL